MLLFLTRYYLSYVIWNILLDVMIFAVFLCMLLFPTYRYFSLKIASLTHHYFLHVIISYELLFFPYHYFLCVVISCVSLFHSHHNFSHIIQCIVYTRTLAVFLVDHYFLLKIALLTRYYFSPNVL